MKCKLTLLCLAILILAWRSIAVPPPASYLLLSVQISASEVGKRGEAMGSGFILQASNSVYLVTARHVLFSKPGTNDWQLNRSRIEVDAFNYASDTNEVRVNFNLDLSRLSAQGEVRHSKTRDIALVRFQSCNPSNKLLVTILPGCSSGTNALILDPVPEQALDTDQSAASVGSDIYLFGYPTSIGISEVQQIDPDRPLLRKGIVAGLNPLKRTMILDCPVYQGNSGGPVLMKNEIPSRKWGFLVIGIAVEWIPFQDVWESKRFKYVNRTLSNSGYSVAEPASAILEMVWR